jgi:hypothetical protein
MKDDSGAIFQRSLAGLAILLALAAVVVSTGWGVSSVPARIGSPLGVLSATLFVTAIVVRALPGRLLSLLLCGSLACAAASIALVLGFPQSGDGMARTLSILASLLIVVLSTVVLVGPRPSS